MANDLVKAEVKKRVRSFWDTREGTVGMAFGLGIFGGIGYAAYKVMPYVASLLDNVVSAAISLVILAILFYVVVLDDTLRNRAWLAYQLLMKAITYSLFSYDPAGTMRALNARIHKMLEDARDAVKVAAGRVQVIRDTLDGFKEKKETLVNQALAMQRAPEKYSQEDVLSHARMIGELDGAITRMTRMDDTFELSFKNLTDAEAALVRMANETEFSIDLLVKEHAAANGIADAWRAFGRVFSRTTSVNQLRDMLSEYMSEDVANKMGEIRTYVDDSKKVIKALQIRDDASTERGLQVLAALNSNIDFTQTPRLQPVPITSPAGGTVDYSRLK
ncbi:hypothetical protein [Paraburkholderia youngii]|uniref:hypothetical protein n=1 Tax=Paraburkholderia youngii TaxID=2782701 RepID=UPI003D19CE02